jgi:hypothetical protein
VRPALRRVLFGFAAGLILVGAPADAQLRPDSRVDRVRWSTRRVSIQVKLSDYDLASLTATVTVPRAIICNIHPKGAWTMHVRADAFFELRREGLSRKPCSDMAIRWTDATSDYHVLSSFDQLIASGDDTHRKEELAFDLIFAAKPDDLAGEYSIELYFDYN